MFLFHFVGNNIYRKNKKHQTDCQKQKHTQSGRKLNKTEELQQQPIPNRKKKEFVWRIF